MQIDLETGEMLEDGRDVLPGMNAGASLSAVPSPIEGSGTAWVLLGSWALSPARPTPNPPRHECRGFSALLVIDRAVERRCRSVQPQVPHSLSRQAATRPRQCAY